MLAAGTTAASAAAAPVLTATEVPIGGGPVTITGTGFAGVTPGIYLGVGPQGLGGFYAGSGSLISSETIFIGLGQVTGVTGTGRTEPMSAEGTFSVVVNVPAGDATSFAAYTSKAHGQGFADTSQNAVLNLAYAAPVVVPPAPTPTITATNVPDGGGAVTLTGTGFAGVTPGIYLGVGPQGLRGFYAGSTSLIASETIFIGVAQTSGVTGTGRTEPMTTEGTFSVVVNVPAGTDSSYAVYTSKAHGQGFADTTQNTTTNLAYAAPVVVEPPVIVDPPVVVPPVVTGPTVTATEVPVGGGPVTLTGTGFAGVTPGIYLGVGPQGLRGFYAGSGSLISSETIFIGVAQTSGLSSTGRTEPMTTDGTFEVTVNVPAGTASGFAVYTSKAHGQGATDTSQNSTTNLTYAGSTEVPPVITPPVTEPPVVTPPVVVPVDDGITEVVAEANSNGLSIGYSAVSVSGGTITISGSGYDPAAPGIYVGIAPRGFAGFYAASAALLPGSVNVSTTNVEGETAAGRTAPMNADGSFSISFAVPAADGTEYAIYTSKAHGQGVSNTSQDAVVDFAFNTRRVLGTVDEAPVEIPIAPVVTAPVVSPVSETPAAVAAAAAAAAPEEVCVARSVSGATLNWAIKDSFRTYIRGGIANGSWDLSSVGDADGKFVWSGGTGAYNTEASRGTISFPGTVHFTGHDGQLDITITDVKLRLSSASSATLTASFNSTALDGTVTNEKNVAFANVAINSASTTGSKLTISNATTTLTTAGAVAFGGFYDAGAALAPLSLTAPLGASVECTDATYSSLATTGTNDITGGLLLAALLALVGFGALSQSRRRSNRTAEVTSI